MQLLSGFLALGLSLTLPLASDAVSTRDNFLGDYSLSSVQLDANRDMAARDWARELGLVSGNTWFQTVQIKGKLFLFRVTRGSGVVMAYPVNMNGSLGKPLYSIGVSGGASETERDGWIGFTAYCLKGKPVLALLNQNGRLRTYQVQENGALAIYGHDQHHPWLANWGEAHAIELAGHQYVLLVNGANGQAKMVSVLSNGQWAEKVSLPAKEKPLEGSQSLSLDGAWNQSEIVMIPTGEGSRLPLRPHLVLLNNTEGKIRILPILSKGTLGEKVFDSTQAWNGKKVVLHPMLYRFPTGEVRSYLLFAFPEAGTAAIHPLNGDGTLGAAVDTRQGGWPAGVSQLASYMAPLGGSHILLTFHEVTGQTDLFSFAPNEPIALAGPMVGSVSPTSAELWSYRDCTTCPQPPQLNYRPAPQPIAPGEIRLDDFQVVPFQPSPRLPGNFTVHLENLTPDTTYEYFVDYGIPHGEGLNKGTFKTSPMPNANPIIQNFTMAVTSCMNVRLYPSQQPWAALEKTNPAFHLIIGDTSYVDSDRQEDFQRMHLRQRTVPQFARIMRSFPTFAIWDDHDYGKNNGDKTYAAKDMSLQVLRELFPNGYVSPNQPGAYFKFPWGNVDFFVLDVRYNRDPNESDDPGKRILGDTQLNWLVESLKTSNAPFKIIASGSTLDSHPNDDWSRYPAERDRLLAAIRENGINGVLFLTGDVHQCFIKHHPANLLGYPLVEVVSSGVANSPAMAFTTLDFKMSGDDPAVVVKIWEGDGTLRTEETVLASQLKPQPNNAATTESPAP